MTGRFAVVTWLVVSIAMSGCSRIITHRAARFDVPRQDAEAVAAATTQPVRYAGVWKVRVRERGERAYHGVDGTERYLQHGDVVGFRSGEDGVIYAVVNKDEIPLALTSDHRRVVWASNERHATGFGQGMADAGQLIGMIAIGVGVVAVVGALAVVSLQNDGDDGGTCP
jgi:uncharacterized protein YceK